MGRVGYNPQLRKYTHGLSMPAGEDDVLMKFFEDSGVPWAPKGIFWLNASTLRRSRMGE